jgi:hypothetical protein
MIGMRAINEHIGQFPNLTGLEVRSKLLGK